MNKTILINRADYPELNFILWDIADPLISAEDAFYYYEKRWPYVNQKNLSTSEKMLIDNLITGVGKNLFLTA